jgi:hypothetical protein
MIVSLAFFNHKAYYSARTVTSEIDRGRDQEIVTS